MITQASFIRDIALQLPSTITSGGVTLLPLSVGAFNMLAAEGAFEPFFVGLLCDERIIANPFLALDSEKLADFMLSDNYVDEVTAWGNTQLRFLYSFVPSKRVEGGTQFKSIVRLKPWNTSIYEALPVCENYEAELAEEAQLMSSLFNYASSQH